MARTPCNNRPPLAGGIVDPCGLNCLAPMVQREVAEPHGSERILVLDDEPWIAARPSKRSQIGPRRLRPAA